MVDTKEKKITKVKKSMMSTKVRKVMTKMGTKKVQLFFLTMLLKLEQFLIFQLPTLSKKSQSI